MRGAGVARPAEATATFVRVAELRSLPPARSAPGTEKPQRFLASAYDSVEAVLASLETVRASRRAAAGGKAPGRLTSQEEDLLRAAIVFTGAGLDATLKQLIRDTLPSLLGKNDQAHRKLEAFAAQRLGTAEFADTKMIARYLVAADARGQLIEDYVYELTGSSLQSAEQVDTTAAAPSVLTTVRYESGSPS